MCKISLKKALKLKNQLISEINELGQLIRSNNSSVVGSTKHYNISELILEHNSKISELVELKTKIHQANAPVYGKIFLLSELKNKINTYKGISTHEGKQNGGYGSTEPIVYEVELNIKQVKSIIKDMELEINDIQDELDTFNAITNI